MRWHYKYTNIKKKSLLKLKNYDFFYVERARAGALGALTPPWVFSYKKVEKKYSIV
tara:strand:- start:10 stop:177 length:168 start_codon:yes stop_codon:yes gene_type:complete